MGEPEISNYGKVQESEQGEKVPIEDIPKEEEKERTEETEKRDRRIEYKN